METDVLRVVSNDRDETYGWGKKLSGLLKIGDVIALYGELGTGKTVFAQGVCAGLDVYDYVTSPTFTLVQEYTGRMPVFHFDFYRVESLSEIEDLDIDGYMMAGGVCIVEWAEKGEALLPESRISVVLDRIAENGSVAVDKRSIRLTGPKGRGLSDLKL